MLLTLTAILISSLAVSYLLYLLAELSRKLGAVTKTRPYYRWLYVSISIIGVTTLNELFILTVRMTSQAAPDFVTSDWFHLIGCTLPLVGAVVIALIVVVRYWGWLFRERV